MQKKLIALAVASALTVPALALADTSNVSVYGIADVSFDMTDNGDAGGKNGANTHKVSSNQSRLGLKGAEDLGGGLKAVWQIEQAISIDNSGTTQGLATRNTFAGLASDSWGQVVLGRNDTPYKTSTRGLDVFMDHQGDNRNLMGTGKAGFDVRLTDTIRYDSPNVSGFKAAVSYTASGENNTLDSDQRGKVWSVSGNYATGPFSAAAAYQKNTFGTTAGALAAGPNTDEKAWKIGGGYKDSQFTVNGVYERTKDNAGAAGLGHKAFYLAGAFKATAADSINLAYTKARNAGEGSTANSGAKQFSVGVDHNMSKRTTFYALYSKLDNDSGAAKTLGIASSTGLTAPVAAGADPSGFSVGMKHTF